MAETQETKEIGQALSPHEITEKAIMPDESTPDEPVEVEQEAITPISREETQTKVERDTWRAVETMLPDIAEAVYTFGQDRGHGVKVARDVLQKSISDAARIPETYLNYFSYWMLPQSKEARAAFMLNNTQQAFNEALLALFCKYFGYKDAGSAFVKLLKEALERRIEFYEEATKMTATQGGLVHTPKE